MTITAQEATEVSNGKKCTKLTRVLFEIVLFKRRFSLEAILLRYCNNNWSLWRCDGGNRRQKCCSKPVKVHCTLSRSGKKYKRANVITSLNIIYHSTYSRLISRSSHTNLYCTNLHKRVEPHLFPKASNVFRKQFGSLAVVKKSWLADDWISIYCRDLQATRSKSRAFG